MRLPKPIHSWRLSPAEAIALQRRLAKRIRLTKPVRPIRYVAGLDAAFSTDEARCVGGVVLWDVAEEIVVEQHVASQPLQFPYIPGLLSFREAPALLAALRRLKRTPDVLMCDGHGLAHPRRFGIACHVGLLCRIPAIGCAKSLLVGTHSPLDAQRGAAVPLMEGADQIGVVVRTRTGVKPVYVSVGHRIDLATAQDLVLRCATRYRLPEPTRLADKLVTAARR